MLAALLRPPPLRSVARRSFTVSFPRLAGKLPDVGNPHGTFDASPSPAAPLHAYPTEPSGAMDVGQYMSTVSQDISKRAELSDIVPVGPLRKERVIPHRLHCHSTNRNTINTFTDPNGNTISWFSGGSCGFKKHNRSSYEAGYQCAVRMFESMAPVLTQGEGVKVDLFLKGYGQGRDAMLKALMTEQGEKVRGNVVSITDRTPIKIGGTRSRKMKRR